MDIVNDALAKTARESEKYKPITVEKHLELEFDVGTLLAIDRNEIELDSLRNNKEDYLLGLTRDNVQLLMNKIWELPTERVEETIVAKLPTPTFLLPRAKPVPKPKPLTKWQQFAKEKGIQKKKKAKLSWDEQLQKWVPMFGYRRAAAQKEKEWLLEVPQNADPMEDQFEKVSNAKSERVAKNELQRLRNIARARNVKIPRVGFTQVDKSTSADLSSAVTVAKASTASVGKFQARLPKEKEARGIAAITPGSTRKRKLPPVSAQQEHKHNLDMVDKVLSKRPALDINKAVSKHTYQQSRDVSDDDSRQNRKKKTTKKPGKGRTGKPGAKPRAGKGQRNPNKRAVGRKRR